MKISDIADIINVTEKDPSNCGIDVFVGLEHYDIAEPVIKRFGSTKMLTTATKKFEAGDVLIARRNVYLQRASVARFSGLTSGDSIILRVKKNLCSENTDYDTMCQLLPFILNSINFWDYANTNADGTMSKRLSPAMLLEYEFDLPSLAEQKVLAEKLWAAYEVKQSYLRMIEATQEMVKSQFIEMFKDTKRERLGDFCTTHARIGWQKLTRAEFLDMGDFYLITGWDIMDDHTVDFSKCKYVSKERYEQDPKLIMREDDVLLTKDGTLGKVAIVRGLDKPATLNGHIFVIRSKDGRIIPEFLIGLFTSNEFICQLNDNKVGSTIAGITQKSLLEFQIPVATIEEQLDFVSIMKQADKSEFELRKSIDAIDKVIKSLINENL